MQGVWYHESLGGIHIAWTLPFEIITLTTYYMNEKLCAKCKWDVRETTDGAAENYVVALCDAHKTHPNTFLLEDPAEENVCIACQ